MILEVCYNIFLIGNTIHRLFTGIIKNISKHHHHDPMDKKTLIKLIGILLNNYFSLQLKLKTKFQHKVYPMGNTDPNVQNYEHLHTFFTKTTPLLYHDNFCNDLNVTITTSWIPLILTWMACSILKNGRVNITNHVLKFWRKRGFSVKATNLPIVL